MWHSESRRVTAKGARRPLIVAAIVGGAVLQHLVVAPTPPASPIHPAHTGSIPAPQAGAPTTGATRP